MPRRENLLLAALPNSERAALNPVLERVPMLLHHPAQEPDEPLSHLWFPHSGVLSMTSLMADGSIVEVATIGREGMAGLPAELGSDRMSQRIFCQIAGEAERLPAAAFRLLRETLPQLDRLLLRYAATLVTQIAQGSACNRLHPVEQRCARWLLMSHDRVDGNSLALTHEFLAQMLGVTRPSVTVAAGMLQCAGLIRSVRGTIEILDRARLEEASCECYVLVREEFARLVRPLRAD